MSIFGPSDTAERLSKEISGAVVVSVTPSQEVEGLFTLRLKKDDKKFDVRVYGTELGWWFKIAGKKP